MTKSPENGESEITRQAQLEARRSGEDVAAILARMLAEAKRAKDKALKKKIVAAQKFFWDRNRSKRRRRK